MTDITPRWYCVTKHGDATLCFDEEGARNIAVASDALSPRNAPHTAVQLAPVHAQPTITPEQESDALQWAGMDGAVAWHLIDRNADGWADVGAMMDAWLDANRAPVPAQGAEGVEALAPRIAGWVCEARNEWCDTVESAWLEDSESHPDADTFVGQYIARRLRNSPESPDGSFREDAERYRWLRNCSAEDEVKIMTPDGRELKVGDDLDAAIDAARSAGGDDEA